MSIWILVALAGGGLSLYGLSSLYRSYRRNRISLASLIAWTVGWVFFAANALTRAGIIGSPNSLVEFVLLLPVFISILILVREGKKSKSC